MVSINEVPYFEIVGISKPYVIVKIDALVGAKLDRAISKFVDVQKEYFESKNVTPDNDDAGEIAFMEKLKKKIQNARDTLLV